MTKFDDDDDVKAAFTQPGGARQIFYKDRVLVAPLDHIKSAIEQLAQMPRSKRDRVLESVNFTLTAMFPKVVDNSVSQEEAMTFCQDIAIWFANEVLEGREPLEYTLS